MNKFIFLPLDFKLSRYTKYPTRLDDTTSLPYTVDLVTPIKAEVTNRLREAILAVETELGISPSTTYSSVRDRLDALEAGIGQGGQGNGQISIYDDNVLIDSVVKELNFGDGLSVTSVNPNRVTIDATGSSNLSVTQETLAVDTNGQTLFALASSPLDSDTVQLYINGIKQQYSSDYTVTENILTYSGSISLSTTDIVEAWYVISASSGVSLYQETVAVTSNGQTSFSLSVAPSDGADVQMFLNGIKQEHGVDYDVVSSTVTYVGTPTTVTTDTVEFWYVTGVTVSGGVSGNIVKTTRVISGTSNVLTTDGTLFVDTTSVPGALTLPSAPSTGYQVDIKDYLGNGAANNIVITPSSGNIDGSGSYTISSNYGSVTLIYHGTGWSILHTV